MINHTSWSRNLGAPRVQLELAEEFRAMGHEVEKLSHEDVFPPAPSRPATGPRRIPAKVAEYLRTNRSFAARARDYVRAHGHRFDVVEANQTDLPFAKSDLRFSGLLVARSVGLMPAYQEFERMAARKWPEPRTAQRLAHAVLTWPGRRRRLRDVEPSFRHADLINVSNRDDLAAVAGGMGFGSKVVLFPFGLSEARREAFLRARAGTEERLAARLVAFIGSWNSRKGAMDWPRIVREVRRRLPEARFRFLGTGHAPEYVRRGFDAEDLPAIEVVPAYDSDELPELLAGATAGAFPGYLEGFGFSVLEKLAAGLPTVTYDAPGPRDMMRHLAEPDLVPAGDVAAFAGRLVRLLTLSPAEHAERSADSARAAGLFSWPEIARGTLAAYSRALEELR